MLYPANLPSRSILRPIISPPTSVAITTDFESGVVLDGLVAVLFAETALLDTAERQLVINDLRGVDPGVAGFDILARHTLARFISRVQNRGTQAENRAIRMLDGLVEVLDANDRQGRSKNFFLDHSGSRINIGYQGRLEVKAFIVAVAFRPLAAENNLGAALNRVVDLLLDFLACSLVCSGPISVALARPSPTPIFFALSTNLAMKSSAMLSKRYKRLTAKQAWPQLKKRPTDAALTAIDIGVVADNHRVAATQFQGDMFEITGGGLHHAPPGIGGAGKADLAHDRINEQFFADDTAGTGDDIQHALGPARVLDRFIDDFATTQVGERRRARRLDDHRIAGEQRRTELVAHQRNRKIPRYYRTADTQRLAQYQTMPAGVEHDRAGAHGFGHTAVVIERMDKPANLEDRLA